MSQKTTLGSTIVINGEITAGEDLVIEGKVTAKKISNPDFAVIVGLESVVEADIEAISTTVLGKYTGTIRARETIVVGERAVIDGDLYAKKVKLHEDAVLNGRVYKQ